MAATECGERAGTMDWLAGRRYGSCLASCVVEADFILLQTILLPKRQAKQTRGSLYSSHTYSALTS